MKTVFLVIISLSSLTFSQEHFLVTGTVRDVKTQQRLEAANIRVLGASRGTVANADGAFRISLPGGTHTLIASCLGYKADTIIVQLNTDLTRGFSLQPSDIILPEVIVSAEDPAIEIIRRAIANKKKWRERLKSFEMEAFTRQVLKRDTSVASITESFTKGYWQVGDTLREIVKQKRQTENVKSEFNFASVGRILNFNDDEIRFIGYSFVGPTAGDALDYYDYKLQRTLSSFGREIYEIKMIPRTKTVPLFEGLINVADESYALMGVDVRPNEAFTIPFVKEKSLRYQQQFGLYEHSYWMPMDIRIDVTATIGVTMIKLPKISFSQSSVISDYNINTTIPDSIFRKPRLSVDSVTALTFDSTFWHTHNVLPLTLEEEQAYKSLDSTQTLEVQFRRGGFSIGIGSGEDATTLSLINNLDFYFNRVDGFHFGGKVELDSLSALVEARGGLAYGFSDKRMKYYAGATVFTTPQKMLGFGLDMYRTLDHRPDAGYYGVLFNSLTSLLAKNDYRDYYEAEGWRAFVEARPSNRFRAKFSVFREEHRAVNQQTNFSLLARRKSYRANPAADEGTFLGIQMNMRIGGAPIPLEIVRATSLELLADLTGQQDGDYFGRAWATGTVGIPTFSRSMLFPQTLWVRLSAGIAEKKALSQFLFDLESATSGYAPFGVFKAMDVKEFSGTRFVALNAEHNFRSVPFLALGIPFMYENSIEFIVHGAIGRTWGGSRYIFSLIHQATFPVLYPSNITNGWYSEIGFGFSRIFDLLRADFTWRTSAPYNFRFTLGAANLF